MIAGALGNSVPTARSQPCSGLNVMTGVYRDLQRGCSERRIGASAQFDATATVWKPVDGRGA